MGDETEAETKGETAGKAKIYLRSVFFLSKIFLSFFEMVANKRLRETEQRFEEVSGQCADFLPLKDRSN